MGTEIRVDKDVTLIREHFQLQHIDYQYMSPVLIPSGYTKVRWKLFRCHVSVVISICWSLSIYVRGTSFILLDLAWHVTLSEFSFGFAILGLLYWWENIKRWTSESYYGFCESYFRSERSGSLWRYRTLCSWINGASNGKVASLIGADMVLVANGGLVSKIWLMFALYFSDILEYLVFYSRKLSEL